MTSKSIICLLVFVFFAVASNFVHGTATPIKCKANEVYNKCSIVCPPQTCASEYTDYDCRGARKCVPGCDCISEYLRNGTEKDMCIPSSQCPGQTPVCGDNEHYETDRNKCELTCDNYHLEPIMGPCQATSACFCDTGYVRDSNNVCIPTNKCPTPIKCKVNEVYNKCGTTCPPQTCASVYSSYDCSGAPKCVPVCECISEYLRNGTEKDMCIPSSQCPGPTPVCGDNEHYETDRNKCELTCDNYHLEPIMGPCQATSACFCDTGYVRDSNNVCIPTNKCPTPIKCKVNEVYNKCGTTCPPQTCASVYSSYDCSGAPKCVPVCECISEYLRNGTEKDMCIPSSQCPGPTPVCGDNEHYETDRNKCELTCDNYHLESIMGPCQATGGCFCDTGYVRDSNNICIPKNKCPSADCKKGEMYNSCGSSCPPSCDNKGNTCLMCTLQCVPGCYCAGKTIRAPDGSCVKPENCPPRKCTGRNEVFEECPETCPRTQECDNLWSKEPCTPIDCCHPQCRCKPGFFRKNGVCVSALECTTPPTQCGHNEVFTDCLNDCQKTCKNRFKDQVCTQICKGSGCICKPDYLRHDNGTCVQEYECCPADCNKGEAYSSCGSSCPPSCENKGNTCLVCTQQCVPGCYCAGRTIRAPDGSCVKPENCPPRKCTGLNEVFDECPDTCPRTQDCNNLWSKEPCTPIDCCHPQCRCKPGFFRKDGVCVSAQECSEPPTTLKPECGLNEHYKTNKVKCELTCKNYHLESIMGPCIPTSGCFCDDGYVRNSYGVCIRKKRCPPAIVCGPNEVLSECYNSCHMTCKTRLRSDGRMCHLACIDSGCLCKEGYLRHDNGTCVPINQCSPPNCNKNETYTTCGSACPATCQNRGDNCTACTAQCVEDCACSKGFIRAGDGSCIKPKDCPKRICSDPNEIWNDCPRTCPPSDGCSNLWSKFNCTLAIKCCKPGCRCRPGYLRKNNVCVPTKKCINSV